MAPLLSFKRFVEQKFPTFAHLFIYAVLEWVMIMLIFLGGFLAFLSDGFAKIFELNIPCMLCMRIDYVLSHRKSNFCYNDSICEAHKRGISSLAYCHVHKKISDIRHMCESCLLSFATEKDSDCYRYKSLLGILHKDIGCFVVDGPRVPVKSMKTDNEAPQVDKDTTVERCSCCEEFLKQPKYTRNASMNAIAPAPSPRAWRNEHVRSVESPRIHYTELKLISDNDSELPDEEDVSNAGGNMLTSRDDTKSEGIQEDACKTPTFIIRGNKFYPLSDSAQASPRLSRLSMDILSDPNDASIANEGDGNVLHRLKRQACLDHKSLMALKQELDEERNASAIAANNAMAMITRLQDEKAALQMEALQYQRMMEEEVEFDQEEVQLMKDMLIKREEEMKILVSELEAYRLKYGPIERVDGEAYEVHGDEDYQELRSHVLSSFEMSECASPDAVDHFERSGTYAVGNVEESSIHYQCENSHLSGWLTNVDNNTNGSSDEGSPSLELNKLKQEGEVRQG